MLQPAPTAGGQGPLGQAAEVQKASATALPPELEAENTSFSSNTNARKRGSFIPNSCESSRDTSLAPDLELERGRVRGPELAEAHQFQAGTWPAPEPTPAATRALVPTHELPVAQAAPPATPDTETVLSPILVSTPPPALEL